MLDINLFREHPEIIIASEKRRSKDLGFVEKTIEYDKQWRAALIQVEKLRQEVNKNSHELATASSVEKKQKSEKMKELKQKIIDLEKNADEYLKLRDENRYRVANLLDERVPDGKSDKENLPISFYGTPSVFKDDLSGFLKATNGKMTYKRIETRLKSHSDLLVDLDIANLKKSAGIAGSRTYYLKNELVFLNIALLQFALEKMVSKGFTPMWPPFWLNEKAMKAVSHFGNFQDSLYKFTDNDNENFYFIPSSEQPMIAYFYNEIIRKKDLPFLCAGISTNFRREASAHGKDEGGIFRVHQFDKIEQIVVCAPEDSEKWHQEILKNGEEILKDLGLAYRVINCCSGDIGDMNVLQYDIEVWMPSQGKFRETHSVSNLKDYQARRAGIRYKEPDGTTVFAHTLNATSLATERVIVAILENFQRKEGTVEIPKVLHKYLPFGITEIKLLKPWKE